jgi:hypothetical protein
MGYDPNSYRVLLDVSHRVFASLPLDAFLMRRFAPSISEEMERALEKERKKRMLDSIPETARVIISEYLTRNYG